MTMYVQKRVQTQELARFTYTRDKVVDYYRKKLEESDHFTKNRFNASRVTTETEEFEGILHRGLLMSVLDARRMDVMYEVMRWFYILRWNIS